MTYCGETQVWIHIYIIHQKLFRYVQKNCKKWSTLCIYECVGLVWYVWQCGFAPVWLNLAQCVHKFHIQCAYAETGWILLKWRCWRCCLKRSDSEPTASCFSSLSLSLSFFLPVKFSFSLHFHTTVLTEGSDRLSWPVMSVGYGYKWGGNRKRESKSKHICILYLPVFSSRLLWRRQSLHPLQAVFICHPE